LEDSPVILYGKGGGATNEGGLLGNRQSWKRERGSRSLVFQELNRKMMSPPLFFPSFRPNPPRMTRTTKEGSSSSLSKCNCTKEAPPITLCIFPQGTQKEEVNGGSLFCFRSLVPTKAGAAFEIFSISRVTSLIFLRARRCRLPIQI
jgi:hypothetical protein